MIKRNNYSDYCSPGTDIQTRYIGVSNKIQLFEIHFTPKKLTKYVVQKGSIALDGISLTVVDAKNDLASVCIIPHTMKITNFKTKKIGDKLNIETDVLGKYILN